MHEVNFSPRFARLQLLLKKEGLQKLQDARVIVLGLGGVGSACAEALARGGVGSLLLVDGDQVDITNINRQAIAFTSTVGQDKTEVMAKMVAEINPDCQVQTAQVFLRPNNIDEVLSSFSRADYVIDCIDTITQKLAIAEWCRDHQVPLLASMGAANKLDPSYLKFDVIEKTQYCPMSKVIRRECRFKGIHHLEVLYSSEVPVTIDAGPSQIKGETLGSMSYMPPIMGQMLAGKVIRRLAGMESYRQTPTS